MPDSWTQALKSYRYPVNLRNYRGANECPGFFTRDIAGDRASTMEFEDYFRANYDKKVEPYFEVVFWKMCSRAGLRDRVTRRIVRQTLGQRVQASELRLALDRFLEVPSKDALDELRARLGIKTRVIAIALTFPAFLDPERYPMMDMNAARWVTTNYLPHNRKRTVRLTPFKFGYSSLRYNDFDNYLNWVYWCRDTAEILTEKTGREWRTRDVEMSVFTAARGNMALNPL
jgi:hypothetical protein